MTAAPELPAPAGAPEAKPAFVDDTVYGAAVALSIVAQVDEATRQVRMALAELHDAAAELSEVVPDDEADTMCAVFLASGAAQARLSEADEALLRLRAALARGATS